MGGADGRGFVLVGGELLDQGEDEGDVWIGGRWLVGRWEGGGWEENLPDSVA